MEKQTKRKNKRKNRNQLVFNPDQERGVKEGAMELSQPSTKAASLTGRPITIGLGLPNPPSVVGKFQAEFTEAMRNLAEDQLPCMKKNETVGMESVVIRKPNQLNYFQNISTTIGYIIAYERGDPSWDWTNEKGNLSPPLSRLMRALDKRTTRIFNQMALCLFGVLPPQRRMKKRTSSSAVMTSSSLSSSIADIFGDSDTDDDDAAAVANRLNPSSPSSFDDEVGEDRNKHEEENASNQKQKKKKKKRKTNNEDEDDSCDDAIVVENVAKIMSKQLDEITKVKVAERHVFALLKGELLNKILRTRCLICDL